MEHIIIQADCSAIGAGLLAERPIPSRSPTPAWWPFRNQLLVTLVLMRLVDSDVGELMLGTVSNDKKYADGTIAFYEAIDQLVSVQEFHPRVTAPAIEMTTLQLVQASAIPREVLSWAHSCQVSNITCGSCGSCWKQQNVLNDLGWIG
jgi:7-cyano-7-deazaguanine synthase